MHFIRSFLRPITETNDGLESLVDEKAEKVDTIESTTDGIHFVQRDEMPVWVFNEVGDLVRETQEISHPNRHWWIVTDGLLEDLDPPLNSHADIFDLLLAINLCISEPVSLSQSPGQTVSGAFEKREKALEYQDELSPGNLAYVLAHQGEISPDVQITKPIEDTFKLVRSFRAQPPQSDEDMDIRVGLHLFDDALTASMWGMTMNFYLVCEGVLCSGRDTNPIGRIADVTELSVDDAENWKQSVNRLKHPDKGGNVTGLIDRPDAKRPTLRRLRKAAADALIHVMETRRNE